jgi:lipopolysaccharide export system permease protein
MTFFIAVFVLLMQFIWLYVDEMLGKGIEWYVIVELLIYSSANVVPLALPLAVLLASLMTFGNLGEHFELVSCKAAGLSLQKIMRPIGIFVIVVCGIAFIFANYAVPVANLKFYSLLYDIRSTKPAVNIKPGVFYNEIEGYTIRVMDKKQMDNGDEMLKDVMIYDHTANNGNRKLTVADSAVMKMSEDKTFFSIKMYHGTDYQDQQENTTNKNYPLSRFSFEENEMRISLAGFELQRTDEEAFKHDYRMFNLSQLSNRIDTLKKEYNNQVANFTYLFKKPFMFADTLTEVDSTMDNTQSEVKKTLPPAQTEYERWNQIHTIALNNARVNQGRASAAASETVIRARDTARMEIEWHRKFSFSLACFLMFLIGAPLGAIVKKGGLGMPVVISVIFFLIFWVLSIVGEDIVKELVLPAHIGMWISTVVLLPLGMFFTYKATTDSAMFNMGAYKAFFTKIFKRKSAK